MIKIKNPFVVLLFSITSCTSNWNKDYAKKVCLDGMKNDATTSTQIKEKMCDCIGEKLVTKYKNETEANADLNGVTNIGIDCAKEGINNIVK